jgi:hypothetical protein
MLEKAALLPGWPRNEDRECKLLGHAMCDIVRPIGKLSIAGQSIIEQSLILSGLTE